MANFVSYDCDPLDNSLPMDVFNKYHLHNAIKYACLWIQVKLIQDFIEPQVSAVTFLNDVYDGMDILETLLDVRDNTF